MKTVSKQIKMAALLAVVLLGAASCQRGKQAGPEAVAAKGTDDGKWSLVCSDGTELISEEYDKAPTMVINGHFMVRDKNGRWEIYTADEKPERVGKKEYKWATHFDENGRALVTAVGEHISIIDKNGEEVKVLDKLGGKTVTEARAFSEGYSVVKCGDWYGVIDDEGNEVIEPKYARINDCSDGKFIAVEKRWNDSIGGYTSRDHMDVTVLNTKGEQVLQLKHNRYLIGFTFPTMNGDDDLVGDAKFQDGKMPVCVKKGGDTCYCIINEKGEQVVKPQAKLQMIAEIKGDQFTYYSGSGWGVMNMDGEIVVRPKYLGLRFLADGLLMAEVKEKHGSGENDYTIGYQVLDQEGKPTTRDTYLNWYPMDHGVLVQDADNSWTMLDSKGQEIKGVPEMKYVSWGAGDQFVQSDVVDYGELLENIKLSPDGVDSLNFSMGPVQMIMLKKGYLYAHQGDAEHPVTDPGWYSSTSEISYVKPFGNVTCIVKVDFSGTLSRMSYTSHTEPYWQDEYYTYYYTYQTPSGYVYNRVNPTSIQITFDNSTVLNGKLRDLLTALKTWMSNNGKVEQENDGAGVYDLGNGRTGLVYMTETQVVLQLSTAAASGIDIAQYEHVDEKLQADVAQEYAGPEAEGAVSGEEQDFYYTWPF